jgi:hypothetical protein
MAVADKLLHNCPTGHHGGGGGSQCTDSIQNFLVKLDDYHLMNTATDESRWGLLHKRYMSAKCVNLENKKMKRIK